MGIPLSQFMEMELRMKRGSKSLQSATPTEPANSSQPERVLHDKIISYCNLQWPRWKFIHARTDQPSTIGVGVCDFTIDPVLARALRDDHERASELVRKGRPLSAAEEQEQAWLGARITKTAKAIGCPAGYGLKQAKKDHPSRGDAPKGYELFFAGCGAELFIEIERHHSRGGIEDGAHRAHERGQERGRDGR